MVAVVKPEARIRPMEFADLVGVVGVEQASYPYPWSRSIFEDCLRAGYCCLVAEVDGVLQGHGIMMVRAGEAHVLNLCVAPLSRRSGVAWQMLDELLDIARRLAARTAFLEVRPSNHRAVRLYSAAGFHVIGRRPGYYPASFGREDALIMAQEMSPADE